MLIYTLDNPISTFLNFEALWFTLIGGPAADVLTSDAASIEHKSCSQKMRTLIDALVTDNTDK